MAEASKGRPWLRYGCFGCIGLIVLVLLFLGVTAFMAHLAVREADVIDGPSSSPEAQALNREGSGGPGTVVLDLRHGDFQVRAAEPGESLGVDARYDRHSYRVVEEFEPGPDGWVYRVSSKGQGNALINIVSQFLGGVQPRVTVRVPPDVPVELDFTAGSGSALATLDGMWLSEARVDVSWAGARVVCSEPAENPVGSLEIKVDMAGLETEQLGNCSPGRLLVDLQKGGGFLDLRGAWARDADVGITGKQTGVSVMLPDEVRVERSGGPTPPPLSAEFPVPTLRIDSTVVNGEVEYID